MKQASILENITYKHSHPAIEILFETSFTKEIRIVFTKGQQMKKHKTFYPIVIEIVKGKIDFGVDGKKHLLNTGNLIALESNIPHDLTAMEESVVRLTLNKNDAIERVQSVVN